MRAGLALEYEDLSLSNGQPVRIIAINNPQKRNCLSAVDLSALKELSQTASEKLLVLTARENVFCSGLDLNELIAAAKTTHGIEALIEQLCCTYETLTRHAQKTFAFVNGPAVGAGVGIAQSFDFIAVNPAGYFELPTEPARRLLVNTAFPLLARRNAQWQGTKSMAADLVAQHLADAQAQWASPQEILTLVERNLHVATPVWKDGKRRPYDVRRMAGILQEAFRPENIEMGERFYLELEFPAGGGINDPRFAGKPKQSQRTTLITE
jgi:hypothetical protein